MHSKSSWRVPLLRKTAAGIGRSCRAIIPFAVFRDRAPTFHLRFFRFLDFPYGLLWRIGVAETPTKGASRASTIFARLPATPLGLALVDGLGTSGIRSFRLFVRTSVAVCQLKLGTSPLAVELGREAPLAEPVAAGVGAASPMDLLTCTYEASDLVWSEEVK